MDSHGEARRGRKTSLYSRWVMMRQRCMHANSKDFKHYGGRGIKICPEWDEYGNFSEWAYKNGYSTELTLDRIDNDGDYAPDNCRWVSNEKNKQNRRTFKNSKTGTTGVSYCRKTKSYLAYLDRYGARLYLGKFETLDAAKIARRSAEKGYAFAEESTARKRAQEESAN